MAKKKKIEGRLWTDDLSGNAGIHIQSLNLYSKKEQDAFIKAMKKSMKAIHTIPKETKIKFHSCK